MSITLRGTALLSGYVVLSSLALGGLTSYAQGWLPGALSSLANSVSGWTALTALVVGLARPRLLPGAALGVASFVCLVLGYTVVSHLRGLAYDPVFWSAVRIVGGPFVGAAAASLAGSERRTVAIGSGLLAGIFLADGIYGLTVVADTTSPVYWTLSILAGAAVTMVVALTRLRGVRPIALLVSSALAVTALGSVAFAVLNLVVACTSGLATIQVQRSRRRTPQHRGRHQPAHRERFRARRPRQQEADLTAQRYPNQGHHPQRHGRQSEPALSGLHA